MCVGKKFVMAVIPEWNMKVIIEFLFVAMNGYFLVSV
jgi:hypothetical protein